MEEYYNRFVTTLKEFLKTLNRYQPTEGVTKFLAIYDNLDHGKLMLRYYNITRDLKDSIKSKNEMIFNNPLTLFPGINISELWIGLSNGQKNKIWTYLQMLHVISELLLVDKSKKESNSQEIVSASEENKQANENKPDEDFNPYVGVGGNDQNYSIEDMLSGPEKLPGSESNTPGLGGMGNMMGIGNMMNIGELRDQLKNMKKEDIDEATNSIKNLLGSDVDDNTSKLISDMLVNITDELKNDDVSSGDPFQNIVKIAETVADRMKPQMESGDVDLSKLWQSTQQLSSNSNAFGGGANPFAMMSKMMGNLPQQMQNGQNENQQVDPQQMMGGYNDMLQNMGVDPNNLDMNNLNKMLQNLPKNNKKK